jgi:hypothetical protein
MLTLYDRFRGANAHGDLRHASLSAVQCHGQLKVEDGLELCYKTALCAQTGRANVEIKLALVLDIATISPGSGIIRVALHVGPCIRSTPSCTYCIA